MEATVTDRIEKQVVLKAPQSRVWRAIADSKEFGAWFGCKFEQPFKAGAPASGRITHPGYEHLTMEILVETIEPERYFAYKWHPAAIDPNVDYSSEPMTLVEFTLEPKGQETVLRMVESGFDKVPLARRADAFRMNEGGWTAQAKNIERYVSQS